MRCKYRCRWDDATCNESKPIARERVAYLLRAARSRGEIIHIIHHAYHRNFVIGTMHLEGTWK